MWFSIITFFVAVIGIAQVSGDCEKCQTNSVACVSATEFRVCTDIVKNIMDTKVYSCPPGEICTALGVVCVNKSTSNAVPSCTSKCGICEVGKTFTCTSRTTFALCSNNEITSIVGTCPDSLYCDVGTGSLCKDKCIVGTNIQCDRATDPNTPTDTPTTTPSTNSTTTTTTTSTTTTTQAPPSAGASAAQICAAKNTAGRFPYENDTACLNYVYCRYQGTTLMAVPSSCAAGTFFNKSSQLCETVKPSGCV